MSAQCMRVNVLKAAAVPPWIMSSISVHPFPLGKMSCTQACRIPGLLARRRQHLGRDLASMPQAKLGSTPEHTSHAQSLKVFASYRYTSHSIIHCLLTATASSRRMHLQPRWVSIEVSPSSLTLKVFRISSFHFKLFNPRFSRA